MIWLGKKVMVICIVDNWCVNYILLLYCLFKVIKNNCICYIWEYDGEGGKKFVMYRVLYLVCLCKLSWYKMVLMKFWESV